MVKEGQAVKVKLLGFDDRGKVRLSMKQVDQATGEDLTKKPAPGGSAAGLSPFAAAPVNPGAFSGAVTGDFRKMRPSNKVVGGRFSLPVIRCPR